MNASCCRIFSAGARFLFGLPFESILCSPLTSNNRHAISRQRPPFSRNQPVNYVAHDLLGISFQRITESSAALRYNFERYLPPGSREKR